MKTLLTLAALFLMSTAANAATIGTFGVNPTSAQGAFSNDPNGPLLGGLFQDQFTFSLVGGPVFITVASATNTFATGGVTGPFGIQNFAASIYQTFDAIIGNGDDVLKFGPQLATLDVGGLSQSLSGNGLFLPGDYYLQMSGDAGALAGYGGNLSTFGVPGPVVGAGLPGLIAAGMLLFGAYRRRATNLRW
jgi:hypothetical protein